MSVNRTLFIELLGGIGDLIFALPAIDAIKRTYPETVLDVLTFAPGGALLVGDPRVDCVLYAHRGGDQVSVGLMHHDVEEALRRGSYDLVVCDARHSGIHELIEAQSVPWKVTHLWKGAGRDEPIPRVFLRRLREEQVIAPATDDDLIRLFLGADEQKAARAVWSQLGVTPEHVVVLNVHSGVEVKRWPAECFVSLGRRLTQDGWRVAVLAGDAPRVAWGVAESIPAARFVPKMDLRLSAACLANTALVVSGDSGLAHLAHAVGTPVVAIYGPTWAGRYGVSSPSINLESPFDCPERNPMNFTTQRCWYTGRCIFSNKVTCCEDVLPEDVLAAARELLTQTCHRQSRIADGERAWPGTLEANENSRSNRQAEDAGA